MTNSVFSKTNPPRDAFVLLPCHTLEDFPTHATGAEAAGLLTAWSLLWHPELISMTGKMPAWQRADTPPDDLSSSLIIVPSLAIAKMPTGTIERAGSASDCVLIRVEEQSRSQLINTLLAQPPRENDRVKDFHALAYVYLQVQLMTRQLRYSSNLDDAYFSQQLVAAADAWFEDDDQQCTAALHNCFDLLAQERDHSFAADPYLIDLTLLAETTLGEALTKSLEEDAPTNLLANAELLHQLARENPAAFDRLRQRLTDKQIGLAGGTIDDHFSLDMLTCSSAIEYLIQSRQRYVELLNQPPDAFGRFAGGLPSDLPVVLSQLGYEGAIFADFSSGADIAQDEAKLMWQSGDAEIQAICSTPLNASDPQTFLGLGPRLGEAVDAGQISTALLVHWPGDHCSAYDDLRRAASWGLALGKFQTLGEYFNESERPYHSFQPGRGGTSGDWLANLVHEKKKDPLSSLALMTRLQIQRETLSTIHSLTEAVSGHPVDQPAMGGADSEVSVDDQIIAGDAQHVAGVQLCKALGIELLSDPGVASTQVPESTIVLNPHGIAAREHVRVAGSPPTTGSQVYAGHQTPSGSIAVIDAPSCGFAVASSGTREPRKRWFRGPKPLADDEGLRNDFFEVALHHDTGGVLSVHTPKMRSNRFSWQLVFCSPENAGPKCSTMKRLQSRVIRSDTTAGEIQNRVQILVNESDDNQVVAAEATVNYRLELGSRFLHIDVDIESHLPLKPQAWQSYVGARVAWAMEAAAPRVIVRDQLQPATGRHLLAPQGVWIDEADTSTMVLADAMPAHRRVGSHMLDTLLVVAEETRQRFSLAYGFDVKNPVATARRMLAPATRLACRKPTGPTTGWLFHFDSPYVVATDWRTQIDEGRRYVSMRLVETMGRASTVTVHCFTNIASASLVDLLGNKLRDLQPKADTVAVKLAPHQISTVRLELS
ncbi:MAG: hypothetical protein R3C05_04035 [Pirellulaceae bacterium]